VAYLTAAALLESVPALAKNNIDDVVLDDLVAEFAAIAEAYRGVAYEPRTVTDETHFISHDASVLQLNHAVIRSITTLAIDDRTIASGSYYLNARAGLLRMPFVENTTVTVSYTHGQDAPDERVLRACRLYVRSCALTDQSGVPRDVIAQSFGDGGYTRFSTPDWEAGRPTGWLEVDRLLNGLPDYRANCG